VSDKHGHDHANDHAHEHDHGAAGAGPLKIALVATAAIAILECYGGFAAHSLALLSDAAHVTMDVVALAIALAASIQSLRPANESHTFGFARLEILAGLGNSALLLAVTVLIIVEAIKRFIHPEVPEGSLMVVIAAIGLVVNLGIGTMLVRTAHDNLNMRAALYHIAGDAAGAIAVVAGGFVIAATGASWIDPALSLLVSAIIIAGIISVARDATHVLLESVPDHAQLPRVRETICSCDGVVAVHDLHVWTIGSASHALSAHVVLDDRRLSEATAVLNRITSAMHDDYAIDHVTVQFECESCEDDDRIVCTQSMVRSREPVSTSGT
jgi:cobalt-zinc-cadmium efflux system protein